MKEVILFFFCLQLYTNFLLLMFSNTSNKTSLSQQFHYNVDQSTSISMDASNAKVVILKDVSIITGDKSSTINTTNTASVSQKGGKLGESSPFSQMGSGLESDGFAW